MKTNQLMLYSEIIAVCFQIHIKHLNTLCGQNVEFFIVKCFGKYRNHLIPQGLNEVFARFIKSDKHVLCNLWLILNQIQQKITFCIASSSLR